MRYTLIQKNGKTRKFYILGVAEMYQSLYGGVVLDSDKPVLKLVA